MVDDGYKEGCDIDCYIKHLSEYLNTYGYNIEIKIMIDETTRETCGIEIKKERINFLGYNSFLNINIEQGIVYNKRYYVRNYGYHYQSDEINKVFRLDGKVGHEPHINNDMGEHIYYNQTELETKYVNLYIMLIISELINKTKEYPLNNIRLYNDSIKKSKGMLKWKSQY